MKVLGICASPRRNGNSEILLDKALEGAFSKGAQVEKVAINSLKIAPCNGSGSCNKNSICCIKDDMQLLYKKLKRADAIIIAAPVYFGSVPAQLKAVIDRCQSVWIENFILKKRKIKHKRKGIFICTSGRARKRFFENSKQIISIFFMVLGVKLFKELYIGNLEDKGDALKRKSALVKAFNYGVNLLK